MPASATAYRQATFTAIIEMYSVHAQESTSFFTRKKTMSVPPKKITGIIDGMKHVYFSKVHKQLSFVAEMVLKVPAG
jgi:hypothetical protein